MTLRGSLFRKYVVYFVALVSVALVVSGGVQLYFTYQENKSALLNLQREKAGAAASRIESYVQEIERQLGWMRLPQVGPQTPEQRRIEYLKLLRLVPAITDVMLLDATGREQLRVSRLGMDVTGGETDLSQENPAEHAVRLALDMHGNFDRCAVGWKKRGFDLQIGIGVAQGYATLGAIGFEGRLDYGAIGAVSNLSARLCSEAKGAQTLIPQRVLGRVEDLVEAEPIGELTLKGFQRPIAAFNVVRLKS